MDNRYLHCVAASVTPRDHFRVKRPGQKFRSSNIGRIFSEQLLATRHNMQVANIYSAKQKGLFSFPLSTPIQWYRHVTCSARVLSISHSVLISAVYNHFRRYISHNAPLRCFSKCRCSVHNGSCDTGILHIESRSIGWQVINNGGSRDKAGRLPFTSVNIAGRLTF